MGTYSSGDLTKKAIYKTAKEVFYEKGYKKTTMKEVCQKANVAQSVFYYHFKNKNDLAIKIYTDFAEKHISILSDEIESHHYTDDRSLLYLVSTFLFYMDTLHDPNLNRFWGEMYASNLPENIDVVKRKYDTIYHKYKDDTNSIDFDFYLISCSSINAPLLMGYYNKSLKMTPDEITRFKIEHTLSHLNVPEDEIKQVADMCIEIGKKIPLSAGKSLDLYYEGKVVEED